MDGVHDLGGTEGFGPVVTDDAELTHHDHWEVRAQVVGILGGASGRAAIEELPPDVYLTSDYYTRWLATAEIFAVRRGIVTEDALTSWRDRFASDPEATVPRAHDQKLLDRARRFLGPTPSLGEVQTSAFAVGDRVRVRRLRERAHHRSPRYLRGVAGVIDTVIGDDRVPEVPRGDSTSATVYTVKFRSTDIWGPTDEPAFEVHFDFWEHYLEPAP